MKPGKPYLLHEYPSRLIKHRTNTTSCALHCFLLACTTRPDVVKKAQEELDQVLGDQFPSFEDFSNLPYLFAVVKEILRWIPVSCLSN